MIGHTCQTNEQATRLVAARPRLAKSRKQAIRVDQWVKAQRESSWLEVTLRESDKEKLTVYILHGRARYWDKNTCQTKHWHIVVHREIGSSSQGLKYNLSNAPQDTSPERLAHMQRQRYWIERSFQDGKNHCGLDHYQARGWQGWHHPVVLIMMAMLFMLKEKCSTKKRFHCSAVTA